MTKETLSYISSLLLGAGINYSFARWNGDVFFPYWVGEYSETDSLYEDGVSETDFILTGTTEDTWLVLQEDKEIIERLFRNRTTVLDSGMGLSMSFEKALIIPTESDVIKRIQINISVKEWRNTNG
ncbi:MAG: hypothetical protein ACI4NM_10800 [Bullifex sp.]